MAEDIDFWAAREGLPEKVVQVLKEQDFNTVEDLMDLSPDDVDECFRKPQLLSVRLCLALKKAVSKLQGGDAPPSQGGSGPVTATPQAKSAPVAKAESSTFSPSRQEYHDFRPAAADPLAMARLQLEHQTSSRGTFSQSADTAERPKEKEWGKMTVSKPEASKGFFGGVKDYLYGTRERKTEEFRFLMLGKTGSGKSTTGNTILGEKKFASAIMFSSVTTECDLQRVKKDGLSIEIMDCPGLYDTSKSQAEISTVIVQAVACTHPGPHAVLYIIRLGRYTEEEFGVYKRLKALFNDDIAKYIIVLFTGGDELEAEGRTLDGMLHHAPTSLLQVIEECGHRYLSFNNKAKKTKPQVEKLLEQVRKMKEHNDEEYYNCPKFSQIGKGLEAEVQKRLAEVEQKDLEREKYVQELEAKTKAAENEVAEARAELERNNQKRKRELEEEKERCKKEAERLRQNLKEAMERELDEERKKRKEKAAEEEMNRIKEKQEKLRKQKEEDEKIEKERVERRQQELKDLERKRQEEERREREERERAYREQRNQFVDDVAKGKQKGWVEWAAGGVKNVITAPLRMVSSWFS